MVCGVVHLLLGCAPGTWVSIIVSSGQRARGSGWHTRKDMKMSKIKNSMDFEFVNSWAGVIVPGKIILVGYKNDGPVWAEVLENKVVGQALCESVLEISYRLLDSGEEGSIQFYGGEEVFVGRKVS